MPNRRRKPRRPGPALFEACEARRHMAVDLLATSMTCADPLLPVMHFPNSFTVNIANMGSTAVGSGTGIVVTLYSVDDMNDPTPEYLDARTVWGIGALQTRTLTFSTSGKYRSDNEGYIIAEVDSQNAVSESNETNNKFRGIGVDMLQYSMEADVSSPSGSVNARPLTLDGRFIDGFIGDESMAGNDIDTYKVSLTGGKNYWFEMYEVTDGFDGAMRLFDSSYHEITRSLSDPVVHGDRGAYIEFSPMFTGDYYLAISTEWNQNGSITNLTDRYGYAESGAFKLAAAETDLPTVYITSADYAAVEGEGESALKGLEFTVRREWGNQYWRPLTVKLEYNGQLSNDLVDALPTTLTIAPNTNFTTFHTTAVDDGLNEMTESASVSIGYSAAYLTHPTYHTQQLLVLDNPQTHKPFALSSGYIGGDLSGPRTYIGFSEDVGYSISADDYVLTNLDTGAIIPVSKYQVLWSASINSSIVYFTGFENGQLPDGNYRMTLRKQSVYTWPDAHQLAEDVNIDFASLRGDTNGDRRVDFADLLTLAQHYGSDLGWDGGAWKGDFDRNRRVDFSDLLTLAQNYGHTLAAPLVAPAASRGRTAPRSGLFASQGPIV